MDHGRRVMKGFGACEYTKEVEVKCEIFLYRKMD